MNEFSLHCTARHRGKRSILWDFMRLTETAEIFID
jgi:hypothetical protein